MEVNIVATKNYLNSLSEIEDFIWQGTKDIKDLENFSDEHDRVQLFIKQNPDTPAPHPQTGDQSWPFGSGRYRVFFKVVKTEKSIELYFLYLIDNRMFNKDVYPNNSMPIYTLDDE